MAHWRINVRATRYREIAAVLMRHGLAWLIAVLELDRFIGLPWRLVGRRRELHAPTTPEQLRQALEELGPTFIKLGQVLSTRPDLLPPEYQRELAKLQDRAPAVAVSEVRAALVAELGQPVEQAFATFDDEPLAAASIGQVHTATLPDGTAVVVKVRRPGAVEQIEADLGIIQQLAAAASRRWAFADRYDLEGLAHEFGQTLRAELDYLREASNAERFAANFRDDPSVHVPRVYRQLTTARVLTLERISGIKIDDLAALDATGIDRQALAEHAANIVLKMIVDDGFFHADPHPGNFFVESNGRIGLIDFGMVGVIDTLTRDRLARLALAVASQDAGALVDALLDLGVARLPPERDLLRRDLADLLARYSERSLGDIEIGPLITEVLALIRRYHLRLPPNLALLVKTVLMEEGLGARLAPTFELTTVLAPYTRRLLLRHYSPLLWTRRLTQAGLEAADLGADLPRHLRRLLGNLERGDLQLTVRPTEMEPILRRVERLVNRLVLGILAAAFVNGLAVLLSTYHLAGWERLSSIFFALGFTIAVLLGLYLAWSILRSGRR
ncbi:MAG: ABC1 kinase family protein [Thermomicrobiales bacterium]